MTFKNVGHIIKPLRPMDMLIIKFSRLKISTLISTTITKFLHVRVNVNSVFHNTEWFLVLSKICLTFGKFWRNNDNRHILLVEKWILSNCLLLSSVVLKVALYSMISIKNEIVIRFLYLTKWLIRKIHIIC